MASVVVGKHDAGEMRDRRVVTKAAIDEIMKYYGFKPVEIPRSIETTKDQLDYALKPHGLMYRPIALDRDWYKSSFGPILAFYEDGGLPVVLLPGQYGGYFWHDAEGNKVMAGKAAALRLSPEAVCFYKPLPMKKIGIPDLLSYMKSCLNWADFAVLIGLTLAVTGVGILVPHITKTLSGFVLESGNALIL